MLAPVDAGSDSSIPAPVARIPVTASALSSEQIGAHCFRLRFLKQKPSCDCIIPVPAIPSCAHNSHQRVSAFGHQQMPQLMGDRVSEHDALANRRQVLPFHDVYHHANPVEE